MGYGVMGQTITISESTPNTACQALSIPLTFNTTGTFLSNIFTIEIIQKDIKSSGHSGSPSACYGTVTSIVSSITTTNKTVNVNLPNSVSGFISSQACGTIFVPGIGTITEYATTNRYFYLKVSNGNVSSSEYSIQILSTIDCSNILTLNQDFTSLCTGSNGNTGNLSFFAQGIQANNVYTVELSEINSYTFSTSPIILGTAFGNSLNSIPITIPSGVPHGSYIVKLKSSNPVAEKTLTSSFVIGVLPSIQTNSSSFCVGKPMAVNYYSRYLGGGNSTSEVEYGYTYQWTKDNINVPSIGTASFFKQSASVADAGDYRLKVTNREGCTGISEPITINVDVSPNVPSIVQELNSNPQIKAIFTGTCSSGSTPHWYTLGAANSFSEITSNYLWDWVTNNGQTFTIPSVNNNTTYYASCRTSTYPYNCESEKVNINLSVSPQSPVISVNGQQLCSNDTAILTANGCASGTITWNDGTTGFTKTVTGGDYVATCTINGGQSNNSNIISIKYGNKPNLVITNPMIVNAPQTIDITNFSYRYGSAYSSETTYSYFSDALGTTPLLNPTAITTSGTFYIKATTYNAIYYPVSCFDIKPIIVTINPINSSCTLQESTKSGNWNDPTLWSCGTIPDKTQDVKINTGHVVILNSAMGLQKCKNLTIAVGGLLQNKGTLSIKEN